MIRLICTIITLQYLFTGLFAKNSNISGESICSYNVIIPTSDVVKKCDAYAEAHLEKLRKRYINLTLSYATYLSLLQLTTQTMRPTCFNVLTFRLQDLQKEVAGGVKSTENIDLLNKCAPSEFKAVYESKTFQPILSV